MGWRACERARHKQSMVGAGAGSGDGDGVGIGSSPLHPFGMRSVENQPFTPVHIPTHPPPCGPRRRHDSTTRPVAPPDHPVQRFILSRTTTALATSHLGHGQHARTALPQPASQPTTSIEGERAPPCLRPPPSRQTPRLPRPWARHRQSKATRAMPVHRSQSATAARRQAVYHATT